MKRWYWTKEDLDILIKNYENMPDLELTKLLQRTTNSIVNKAHQLKLKKDKKMQRINRPKTWIRWTEKDDNFLKENYSKLPMSTLCKILNRNFYSIRWRSSQLRIKRRTREQFLFTKKLTLSDIQKGYIAGFIDGEGYLGIVHNGKYDQPAVTIGNTNKESLEKIKEWLKMGNITTYHSKQPNRLIAYQLCIRNSEDIYNLLKVIESLLIIKKVKAKEIIKFIEQKFYSCNET